MTYRSILGNSRQPLGRLAQHLELESRLAKVDDVAIVERGPVGILLHGLARIVDKGAVAADILDPEDAARISLDDGMDVGDRSIARDDQRTLVLVTANVGYLVANHVLTLIGPLHRHKFGEGRRKAQPRRKLFDLRSDRRKEGRLASPQIEQQRQHDDEEQQPVPVV